MSELLVRGAQDAKYVAIDVDANLHAGSVEGRFQITGRANQIGLALACPHRGEGITGITTNRAAERVDGVRNTSFIDRSTPL